MYEGVINKFNRGEIDETLLARDDVTVVNNSASYINNFLPVRSGPMYYRQGSKFLGNAIGVGQSSWIPFVGGDNDYAILELADHLMRVWINDKQVTRTAVTSVLLNGEFNADINNWTNISGSGATVGWNHQGFLFLKGTDTTRAAVYQTFASTQLNREHGLRIVNRRGPVGVKIGTTGSDSSDIFQGILDPGTHSFAFTPKNSVTITLYNDNSYVVWVDSVTIEPAGVMTLETPFDSDFRSKLRFRQSADVVFAVGGGNIFRIQRRGRKSWSVVGYRTEDGPFDVINTTNIALNPNGLSGDVRIFASASFFKPNHVGANFKIGSAGQQVASSVSSENSGTDSIRVTGVADSRAFTVNVSGTFAATVTLQRSDSGGGNWEDVEAYTTSQAKGYDDSYDNSIFYYRLHVKTGDFTSGTVLLNLTYDAGSIEGIARVTSYISPTEVLALVFRPFGSTVPSTDWYEGSWSHVKGFPTALSLYEGRLWAAGRGRLWASVSDAYNSFDTDVEGDSASIFRTIGFGPADDVAWMSESPRLMMGLTTDEVVVRSNGFGEILTPSNVNLKSGTNRGAAPIDPVKIDDKIYFVQRSGIKIFSLSYDASGDMHSTADLTVLHPTICAEGILKIVYTREPETRIWALMEDGTLRVYLFDLSEQVSGWSRINVLGKRINDIFVLPGKYEDRVYMVINGMLAKMDLSSEASTDYFDLAISYSSPGTVLTGLDHLEGIIVGVHADGEFRGYVKVVSGQITVSAEWEVVNVGLWFNADYTSNRLGQYSPRRVLNRNKRVVNTGLIMRDYIPQAIKIGPYGQQLRSLPTVDASGSALISSYDELPFDFDGEDETDPRLSIQAVGPCKIMALTYSVREDVRPKDKT